jgi:hypothetical protein
MLSAINYKFLPFYEVLPVVLLRIHSFLDVTLSMGDWFLNTQHHIPGNFNPHT